MPRVRRAIQDHAAVREDGGVIPTPTPTPPAAVTAAVLRALELAAELGVVRVWGMVDTPPATRPQEQGRVTGDDREMKGDLLCREI